ncbi:MAG: hypothetical protein JWQ40_3917 [Segetibacter sp.]|jgi:hypothetical protein|nr:hypothetical protein [Segetibacter sp.]
MIYNSMSHINIYTYTMCASEGLFEQTDWGSEAG